MRLSSSSILSVAIAIAVLAIATLTFLFRSYVPIWDGGWFFGCAISASETSFSLSNFNCGVHEPAVFYMGLLSIVQYLSGRSTVALHLLNTVLFLLGLLAFYKLTSRIVRATAAQKAEVLLLTFILAVTPVFLANVYYLSLDFAVTVFFLGFLYSIVSGRSFLLGLTSFAMALSKEIGFMIYGASIPVWAALQVFLIRRSGRTKSRLRYGADFLVLLLPGFLHLTYSWYRPDTYSLSDKVTKSVCWADINHWYDLFLRSNFGDKHVQNYLFNIFGLNFNWLISIALVIALFKWIRHPSKAGASIGQNLEMSLIVAMLLVTTYLVTRCPFYNNPKYVLPVLPLVLLTGYLALLTICKSSKARVGCLILCFLVFASSTFRTVDPVSKWFYGTFPFGNEKILLMTGRTDECCGYGQDQLVYNLEFTRIHYILNDVIADLRPSESEVIVAKSRAWLLLFFDAVNFKRSLRPEQPINFREMKREEVMEDESVKAFYYIRLPWMNESDDLAALETRFNQLWAKEYWRGGYSILVRRFESKPRQVGELE